MIKTFIAVLLGKIILILTKNLNLSGGSAAPGYYGLKIEPRLISKLASQIKTSIIVTGTNGKTTTSRLINHFLKTQGTLTIRNQTGSNLERGIASALIANTNLFNLKVESQDVAIWEVDEAAFNSLALKIKPQVIVFLNVYRDQLDRYGEVDSVLKKWQETLQKLSNQTLVVLNGDDANISSLEDSFKGKIVKFGVKGGKIKGEGGKESKIIQRLDLEADQIERIGLEGVKFRACNSKSELKVNLPLPGIYHIYDFLGACAVGFHLNLELNQMAESLKNYSPAFGRMEKLQFKDNKKGYIFLIKNPTGATQVFETIKNDIQNNDTLLLVLNDNFADGRDVSWIWDAEVEQLRVKNLKFKVIASGQRAYDLAVRLKYAGFEDIQIERDLSKALNLSLKRAEGKLFILSTYTAMLKLQSILTKKGLKKAYWEDEG